MMDISSHAAPIKKLQWLSSVFCGILMCKIVYDLTGAISASFFKGYKKLNNKEKLEWNNRGFSTFHAIVVAAGSLYLLLFSDLFVDSVDMLFINRSSTLSDTILGVSIGYFLSDLAMICYTYPALGGMEYILHHGLSMFSIIQSLFSGQAQFYIFMVLFTEITTPFVNLRWQLDVAGLKDSKLYIYNGVALFIGWLVARIILFAFLFCHMFVHFDQVKKVYSMGFYSLILIPPVLSVMNLFWFWKIAKELVRGIAAYRMMWRNRATNILRQALRAGGRPGIVSSSSTKRFAGYVTPSLRHYCGAAAGGGDGEGNGNAMTYAEAKRLMRLVNVGALKEKLGMEDKEVIPYAELLEACENIGVAKSTEEAAAFARVLDEAGVILLFRDKVYLHPDKVVDLVRKAVPLALLPEDDPCQIELKKLQEKKDEINMLAHKQVRRILWTGLGFAVCQVGLFFRLTFWEFSWDVMEPIAFFTTATGIVIGYAYFLFTSKDPSYQDLLRRLFLSRQRKLIKKHNFDIQRLLELQKKCRVPHESCSAIKRRTGVELEPEDLLHDH